jgi:hypothetical protein
VSEILIVGEKNKIFFLPTYLPIGHIAESERGNKQYFNLGLSHIVFPLKLRGGRGRPMLDSVLSSI